MMVGIIMEAQAKPIHILDGNMPLQSAGKDFVRKYATCGTSDLVGQIKLELSHILKAISENMFINNGRICISEQRTMVNVQSEKMAFLRS